jgi:hypothetical protein
MLDAEILPQAIGQLVTDLLQLRGWEMPRQFGSGNAIQLQIQKNGALEAANIKQSEEIAKLHVHLDAARQEVRDIAKSAVEGASGQVALQKVMEVRQDNGGQPRGKS